MKIYQILPNGYLGEIRDVPDGTPGIPVGFTRTVAPEIPENHYGIWQGNGWGITENPPPVPQPPAHDPKSQRVAQVAAIVVTTESGKTFDGNEDAQNRMSRAVTAMENTDTIPWVLADNTVAMVTRSELREALRLAGAEMASIWVAPYTT
jgi:hypothetical protein